MYELLTIVGNLGDDPKTSSLPSGDDVCNFDVAVNRNWTNREGERQTSTKWFQVAVFGPQAAPCQRYLRRGRQVMVLGRVTSSAYMGQDGKPRSSLRVRAQTVHFLGGRESGDAAGQDWGRSDTPSGGAPGGDAWDMPQDFDEGQDVPF